jgi:hypothetical protein
MNRYFKNVNAFGLMGMVLAGGLVFTQSAFKPAQSDKAVELIYGYDQSNPANPWVANNTSGYQCEQIGDLACKYVFTTPPTPETDPQDSTPAPNTELGSYQQD